MIAVKVPLVPPSTVTSPASNPVTGSEKAKVAVMGVAELILAGTPVIVTTSSLSSFTFTDRVVTPYSSSPIRNWYVKETFSSQISSSSSAEIVTVCGTDQFEVVNVRLVMSSSTSVPCQPVMPTIAGVGGGPDTDTVCTVLPPSETVLSPPAITPKN